MRLDEILQEYFGCKNPFLKNKRAVGYWHGGEPEYQYMTAAGARAYEKLVSLIQNLGVLLEATDEAERWVRTLDEIVSDEGL